MAFQDDMKDVIVKYGKKTILDSSLYNILKDTSSYFRDHTGLQLLMQQFVNGGYSARMISCAKSFRKKRDRECISIVNDFASYAGVTKDESLSIIQYFRYALSWDKHYGDFPHKIDTSWSWSDVIEILKQLSRNKYVICTTAILMIICVVFLVLWNVNTHKFQETLQEYNSAEIIDNSPETVLLKVTELQSKYSGIFSSSDVDFFSVSIFEKAVSSKCKKLLSLQGKSAVIEWLNSYLRNNNLTNEDRAVLQDYILLYKNY